MSRVVKLTRIDDQPVYIRTDLVAYVDASESRKGCACIGVSGALDHVVTGSPDEVARLIWLDLDKPAAPAVSDEDVAIVRAIVADCREFGTEHSVREADALDRILAALGR